MLIDQNLARIFHVDCYICVEVLVLGNPDYRLYELSPNETSLFLSFQYFMVAALEDHVKVRLPKYIVEQLYFLSERAILIPTQVRI